MNQAGQNNFGLYLIEILHQTTTHANVHRIGQSCILLKFYIKPQLVVSVKIVFAGCILLKFYIKPQPENRRARFRTGCILLKFYIKPQPKPKTEV